MGEQPHGGKAGDVDDVLELSDGARLAVEHVEHGGADEACDKSRDHWYESGDARGPPCRKQEPHRESEVEGTDVTRSVHRRTGVVAQNERGHGHCKLHQRDDDQRDPQCSFVRGAAAMGTDGRQNRRSQVRHVGRAREPRLTVQGRGISRKGAAGLAPSEVVVERSRVDPGILAVEASRERGSGRLALHDLVVDPERPVVPRYRPAMDRLTGLLVQARDGDRLALAAAIRASQGEVWRLAAHLVGLNEADDVTQVVFLRAWRALPSFRAESSGRTWLLSIARRACVDAVRRQSRWRRLARRLHSESAATGRDRAAADEWYGLTDLVARLVPSQREAFVLTQITGCSYAEAAELCGVQIGTIRSRVARARLELVSLMREARAV